MTMRLSSRSIRHWTSSRNFERDKIAKADQSDTEIGPASPSRKTSGLWRVSLSDDEARLPVTRAGHHRAT
jgi:hypothetical protein